MDRLAAMAVAEYRKRYNTKTMNADNYFLAYAISSRLDKAAYSDFRAICNKLLNSKK